MARRAPPSPTAPKLVHTRDTIKAAISRLQKRLIEVESFDPAKMQEKTPAEITALSSSIKTSLARAFGDNTEDYHRFAQAADIQWFEPPVFMAGMPQTPLSSYIEGVSYNKERSIAQLREAIKTLLEDYQEMDIVEVSEKKSIADPVVSRKIFIVHGRDNDAKNEVARFLSKIGLEEVILHERANRGRHLLTKFQEEAEGASFAVILLTPDDQGGLPGDELKKRARQNVVFEFGFFTGKIGPARVVALVKGDIEKPSDIDGLAYVSLDPTGAWKGLLARELSAAKIPFDPAKVFEV